MLAYFNQDKQCCDEEKPGDALSLDAIDPHLKKMINPSDAIRDIWKKCFDLSIEPQLVVPLGGGSINAAFKIVLEEETVVLKVNRSSKYPGMFTAEQKGLELLRNANGPSVPEIICNTTIGEYQYLVLEYINPGPKKSNYSDQFGAVLAALHRNTNSLFGLDHDNYIGSLPQKNTASGNLYEFLVRNRYEPLLRTAVDKQQLNTKDVQAFSQFFRRLPELLPNAPPTLIHGDLWNGNVITDAQGYACLIDPAVAFVHREADISMTYLFGGFDDGFYRSYNQHFPLEKGFQQRIDLWNLYPLLVHVVHFGGSYVNTVRRILHPFGI